MLYKGKNRKMPIKSVKMKMLKNKQMRFVLISQGWLNPKIRFLSQKLCPAARVQTHTQRQTDTKVNTEDTLSGFQEFSFQPIIKDRSNIEKWASNLLSWPKSDRIISRTRIDLWLKSWSDVDKYMPLDLRLGKHKHRVCAYVMLIVWYLFY